MKVLITGGAGYIGSTVASALEEDGHLPVILDSLITGREEFTAGRIFYRLDIADHDGVLQVFADHPDIEAVIHCAAFIVVPESVEEPYRYYLNNVVKSLELFKTLEEAGCRRIVFSSSASIYDAVPGFMATEEAPLNPSSPYARTKFMMEMILRDMADAGSFRGIALRYFNPLGADPRLRSGIHVEKPSHVIGKLVDVALGKEEVFRITGTDWPTRDGSGIRDYIHVWDLAKAHVKAVTGFDRAFDRAGENSYLVINLGSGRGVTVKELLSAFERVWGAEIPKEEAPPRPGDVAGAYASAEKALELLDWKAELSMDEAIDSSIRWGKVRGRVLGFH